MICPRCGSNHVVVQQQAITKNKLRLGAALIISPLALAAPKTKTKYQTVAVCQNCGNTFNPAFARYTKAPKKKAENPSVASAATSKSIADELEKYSSLLDKGVISQEEFDLLKSSLIGTKKSSPNAVFEQNGALDYPKTEDTTAEDTIAEDTGVCDSSSVNLTDSSTKIESKTPCRRVTPPDDDTELRFSPVKRKKFRIAFYICAALALIYFFTMFSESSAALAFCIFLGASAFCLLQSMTAKAQTQLSVNGKICPLSKRMTSTVIWFVAILLLFFLAAVLPSSGESAGASNSDVTAYAVTDSDVSSSDISGSDFVNQSSASDAA